MKQFLKSLVAAVVQQDAVWGAIDGTVGRLLKFAERARAAGGVPVRAPDVAEQSIPSVFPDLVVYDEKSQPFTVKYHEMAPMLPNEMKKQRATAEEQQHAIARLEAQQRTIEGQAGVIDAQQQEIAALSTRLARLETRN